MKIHKKFIVLFLTVVGVSLSGCGVNDSGTDLEELDAKIDASSVNFVSDLNAIDGRRIRTGQTITLTDGSTGDPDQWQWEFSDDTNTITGEEASLSWGEAVGKVTITLTVTRSSDGATDTDEMELQVGPVEKLNKAVFTFDDEDSDIDALSKWFSWTPNEGTISTALETSDGADGTTQSIKLTANAGFEEFQLRPHENGPEYLVSLESSTSYVFSFYMKASEAITLSEVSILNVKNDAPKEGWYTPLWTGDSEIADPDVTTDWKKFSYEFTTADLSTFADEGYADGTADNAGPFFKHIGTISGSELSVWIDEMSLKEKEQN